MRNISFLRSAIIVVIINLIAIFFVSCVSPLPNYEMKIDWVEFELEKIYPIQIQLKDLLDITVKNPMITWPENQEVTDKYMFTADLAIKSKSQGASLGSGIRISGEFKIVDLHNYAEMDIKQTAKKSTNQNPVVRSEVRFVGTEVETFPVCDVSHACTDEFRPLIEKLGNDRLKEVVVFRFDDHNLCHEKRFYRPKSIYAKKGKLIVQLELNPLAANIGC